MHIIITARHMEVTQAIRDFVEKKISRISKYYNRISKIEVVLDAKGTSHTVEIIANADKTQPFVVSQSGEDMYACLDAAVDKCERKLTRHKEKSRDRKHRPGAAEVAADIMEAKEMQNGRET